MKVGVAIPAYNAVKWIENGLRSCWAQTYPCSVYIADDASDDGMSEFLQDRPTWYRRYLRYDTRAGWPMNTNRAVNMAFEDGCDVVQFLSADDFLRLDCIDQQVRGIQRADFSVPYVQMVGDENIVQASREALTLADVADWPHMVDKIMIRREAWEKVGGYSSDVTIPEAPYGAAEDWDFVIKLLKAGLTYTVVKDPIYYYLMHPGQLWRGRNQVHQLTMEPLRRKYPEVFNTDPKGVR